MSMPSTAADGTSARAVRRDYRELVPLLRHRHQPGHSAVKAVLTRDRDVRTTIDARLQARVAQILQAASARSTTGHAAAVVLDAGHRRRARARQLSLSRRGPPGAAGQRRSHRAVLRPRALRPLSAGIDVQARDRGRGAAAGPGAATPDLQLRLAARRAGRRPNSRRAAGARRRARSPSARHDRHARRPGALVQRLLRAAGAQAGTRGPARCGGGARDLRSRRADRSSGCGRRCRRRPTARATWWPARCAWRGWRRRWPTAACSPSRASRYGPACR